MDATQNIQLTGCHPNDCSKVSLLVEPLLIFHAFTPLVHMGVHFDPSASGMDLSNLDGLGASGGRWAVENLIAIALRNSSHTSRSPFL